MYFKLFCIPEYSCDCFNNHVNRRGKAKCPLNMAKKYTNVLSKTPAFNGLHTMTKNFMTTTKS